MVDIINNMKYDFDPSLKSIYTKFVPPFNEVVFFFSRFVAHLSPYPRKLKKVVDVKIIKSQNKADNFKIYTISKKGSNIDSLTPVFYLHGGAFAFNASLLMHLAITIKLPLITFYKMISFYIFWIMIQNSFILI